MVKYVLAFEQGEKKVDSMRAQMTGVRQGKERVAQLEDKVRQLSPTREVPASHAGPVPGVVMKASVLGLQ